MVMTVLHFCNRSLRPLVNHWRVMVKWLHVAEDGMSGMLNCYADTFKWSV